MKEKICRRNYLILVSKKSRHKKKVDNIVIRLISASVNWINLSTLMFGFSEKGKKERVGRGCRGISNELILSSCPLKKELANGLTTSAVGSLLADQFNSCEAG